MPVLYANNSSALLAAAITNIATSMSVTAGKGALFPAITSDRDYFYVTLIDASNNVEIVKVTARTGDVFTISRGQDNTTARAFSVGAKVESRVVAATLNEKLDVGNKAFVTKTLSNVNVTISGTDVNADGFVLNGVLTANVAVIVPALPAREYTIINKATGAFQVTVRTPAGSGVIVQANGYVTVYSDGTNIVSGIPAIVNGSNTYTGVNHFDTLTTVTKAPGTNTTDAATTAFVTAALSGLGTMSTQNATAVAITGGAITGATVNGNVVGSNSTGAKTVSTAAPSGGADGDIWYQY